MCSCYDPGVEIYEDDNPDDDNFDGDGDDDDGDDGDDDDVEGMQWGLGHKKTAVISIVRSTSSSSPSPARCLPSAELIAHNT